MRVILEIESGGSSGRKIHLRDGEAVRVGRTEWSDVAIPDDVQLSSEHFSIECQPAGCFIRDLGSTNGTLLNGERVAELVRVQHGDQIVAGTTRFLVKTEWTGTGGEPAGQPVQTAQQQAPPPPRPEMRQTAVAASPQPRQQLADEPPKAAPQPPAEVADLCARLSLEDTALALIQPGHKPLDYLKQLLAHELFTDAVRFWSLALPVQSGVLWASSCVRDALADQAAPQDLAALDAADQWALEPNEKNRRAAEAAAEATKFEGAAGWVALAAFWSGGSMAPAGLPEVPPAEGLAAKGIAGALMMAATSGPPQEVISRYRKFLEQGIQISERSTGA
jgi:hypothetical protein